MAESADWQVYIVECADASLYTGIARNLGERIAKHNSGSGAKYTRSRLPVRLVYSEGWSDMSGALQREASIKRLPRIAKLELIATMQTGDAAPTG